MCNTALSRGALRKGWRGDVGRSPLAHIAPTTTLGSCGGKDSGVYTRREVRILGKTLESSGSKDKRFRQPFCPEVLCLYMWMGRSVRVRVATVRPVYNDADSIDMDSPPI